MLTITMSASGRADLTASAIAFSSMTLTIHGLSAGAVNPFIPYVYARTATVTPRTSSTRMRSASLAVRALPV